MSPKGNSPLMAYGIYGAAGFQLAVSTVAGILLGNYLDKKLETSPWLVVAGTIAGFAGGIYNLIRILRIYDRDQGPSEKDH